MFASARLRLPHLPSVLLTFLAVMLIVAFFAGIGAFATERTKSLATTMAIFVIACNGLAFLYGRSGLLSMAHAGAWGLGAYAAGIASEDYNVPMLPVLGISLMLGAAFGLLSALPSLRARGHYLLIVTFIITVLFTITVKNLGDFTGAHNGFLVLERPSLLGWRLDSTNEFLGLYSSLMGVSIIAFWLLNRTRFGRLLVVIKENEDLARSLGIATMRMKFIAFAISGAFAGLSGALLTFHLRFLAPDFFGLDAAIQLTLIVLIGGAMNVTGPFFGAMLVVFLPELLSFSPNTNTGVNGVLLIAIMLAMPFGMTGVVGQIRSEGRRLWERLRGTGSSTLSGEPTH